MRSGRVIRRKLDPDPIYNSRLVTRFINKVMIDGKKSVAERIVYDVFAKIKSENNDPLKILHQAISNIAPEHEVKPRRLGGASYLVPIEVRKERRIYLALNWLIEKASLKSNKEFKTFSAKLYKELMDASNNIGDAVNKKIETEKLAEANKAFSHLKW